MALHITIAEEKDVVVLEMAGRIDSFSIEELNAGFDKVMKTGKSQILLVMRDLEYINSRGIGALISFLKWVKKVGGLVKIAEVPLNVMQVLNLLGLDGLALIYDSSSDAMGSFRRQQEREEDIEQATFSPGTDMVPKALEAGRRKGFYLLLGGWVGLCVAGVVLFLQGASKGPPAVALRPLEKKLGEIEERVGRLETREPGAGDSEARIRELADRLVGRMDEMARQVDGMRKRPEPSGLPQESVARTKKTLRHHVVRPGESLYRIGRRYGVSVEELRRLNRLDAKGTIRVGQKLVVGQDQGRE
ncbi:MAG: LysM peptidoglycan-binding domain-containing protein [Deltaproteobacteria bacterium]|nr:LysM peptidoglycan-binding domain-containing protein [Deltaproteobacteria bacterium]